MFDTSRTFKISCMGEHLLSVHVDKECVTFEGKAPLHTLYCVDTSDGLFREKCVSCLSCLTSNYSYSPYQITMPNEDYITAKNVVDVLWLCMSYC
jgi:hypothetical protein